VGLGDGVSVGGTGVGVVVGVGGTGVSVGGIAVSVGWLVCVTVTVAWGVTSAAGVAASPQAETNKQSRVKSRG
jgi:hypothetical protein